MEFLVGEWMAPNNMEIQKRVINTMKMSHVIIWVKRGTREIAGEWGTRRTGGEWGGHS